MDHHLPGELLADIFRRLPPRSLAACRSVRKEWCAEVDAGGMLLPFEHLVPRRLRGVFINYDGHDRRLEFFSRPAAPIASTTTSPDTATAAGIVDGALDFLDVDWHGQPGSPRPKTVLDHRNGLVLCKIRWEVVVCNPATRRSARLPHLDARNGGVMCLVFDPTVSLHYDVVFFPDAPRSDKYLLSEVKAAGAMEWPPASYTVHIFSSRTGRWERRLFARGAGDAPPVTVSDVWSDPWGPESERLDYHRTQCRSVYWRGTLYVHCRGGFLIRLSLQEEKYVVIKNPKSDTFSRRARSFDIHEDDIVPYEFLGKSKQGVYYTAFYRNQLRVWVLHDQVSEPIQKLEWELKYQADLQPSFLRHYIHFQTSEEEITGSWMSTYRDDGDGDEDGRRSHGWESDDDDIVADVGGGGLQGDHERLLKKGRMHMELDLLGFHPHKEIVFLRKRFDGFAYHLATSKLQYLGSLGCSSSEETVKTRGPFMYSSFIYTPCLVDIFPH